MSGARAAIADRIVELTDDQVERLRARWVEDASGCWIWQGSVDRDGYGTAHVKRDGKSNGFRAHRLVYQLTRGVLDVDLDLDHTCRVRACVNPSHLDVVTNAENLRRGAEARTSWRCGHDKDGNTLKGGGCKRCKRDRARARRASNQ